MRRLILGFVATVMVSASSFGQNPSETSKKNIVNAQMVTLVNTTKAFYVKGQTYDDFVRAMLIPSPTVPSQDELFRKVFGYLNSGTADCDILKGDNSALGRFAQDLANSPKNMSTPNSTYSLEKKWWQILINAVVNAALDAVFIGNNETVDLFPEKKE